MVMSRRRLNGCRRSRVFSIAQSSYSYQQYDYRPTTSRRVLEVAAHFRWRSRAGPISPDQAMLGIFDSLSQVNRERKRSIFTVIRSYWHAKRCEWEYSQRFWVSGFEWYARFCSVVDGSYAARRFAPLGSMPCLRCLVATQGLFFYARRGH